MMISNPSYSHRAIQPQVRFQATQQPSFNAVAQSVNQSLTLSQATPADKPQILQLLKNFYLDTVNPASQPTARPGSPEYAAQVRYVGQGTQIFEKHLEVIDANLAQANAGNKPFHLVKNSAGEVVASAALMESALNQGFTPPADVIHMPYFYQAEGTPKEISLWMINDLAAKAKNQGYKTLCVTTRRLGMDERNNLIKEAGFQEVTDPGRIAQLAPPVLRSPRTLVYEKAL